MQSSVEIYRAQDSVQAHLIASQLDSAGVEAWVDGSSLQSALGEIPLGWATAPRVMVDSAQAHRARALLDELEIR